MADAPAAAPVATPAQTPAAPAAAPAPSGNAPATPAPASTPAPAAQPGKSAESMNDAYAMLDRMAGEEAPAQQDNPPADPGEDPEAQEAPAQPDNKQAGPGEKPKAKTLRQALDEQKRLVTERDKRIRELEELSRKPVDDPEKKKLSETLTERDKRLQELEEELRYADYTKSAEYKERYAKPFYDAFAAGRAKATSLKFTDNDGIQRQGTEGDFDNLMRITDDDTAAEFAAEQFGTKATLMMYHRERVQETRRAAETAVEDFRKNGATRDQQRQEATSKHRAEMARAWETETKAGVEKYPQWFKPATGDDAGNAILEKGYELADIAFGREVKGPDGKPIKLTPQEMVKLHAAIRNKAGAFDRLVHVNKGLKDRVRQLEKDLADYKESEPGPGSGRGKAPAGLSTWDQVDASLAKLAR